MAGRATHIIRASLDKDIYRDIEILSEKTLYALAQSIVRAFDFDFDHAFGFYSKLTGNYFDSPIKYELFADMGESDARSVKRTRLAEAFPRVKTKMLFLFDYGDGWQFKVECVGQSESKSKTKYPRIVKTVGEAPEQYPEPNEDLEEEREIRGFTFEKTADGRFERREIVIKVGKGK
jgi:hypothetical protein